MRVGACAIWSCIIRRVACVFTEKKSCFDPGSVISVAASLPNNVHANESITFRDWLIGACAYHNKKICAYYMYALISGY